MQYDVQISELIDGEEVIKEENEIFIEDSYVTPEPPSIVLNYTEDMPEFQTQEMNEVTQQQATFYIDIKCLKAHIILQIDDSVGRGTYNLSDLAVKLAFDKKDSHVPEEHMNFQSSFGINGGHSPFWSEWTCCRPVVNIQSRQRVRVSPRIELEYRKCWKDFCSRKQTFKFF